MLKKTLIVSILILALGYTHAIDFNIQPDNLNLLPPNIMPLDGNNLLAPDYRDSSGNTMRYSHCMSCAIVIV